MDRLEQLLADSYVEGPFDQSKGKTAFEVRPGEPVRIVATMNIYPLPAWDVFYVRSETYPVAPEMRDAWRSQDANRVLDGAKALVARVGQRWSGGWFQTVEVEGYGPVTVFARGWFRWDFKHNDLYLGGAELWLQESEAGERRLHAMAWMHAWSNHDVAGFEHVDDGRCSVGVGCEPVAIREGNAPAVTGDDPLTDAVCNATMQVGIDPGGGVNPLAEHVVWGEAWHVYNGYCQVLLCDYTLPAVDEESWRKTTILLPQEADEEWRAVVGAAAAVTKRDVTQSADYACDGDEDQGVTVCAVNPEVWGEDPTLATWARERYPGATIVPVQAGTPYEAAVLVLPPLEDDVAVAQVDPRWAMMDFGEGLGSRIRDWGCFLAAACMVLRAVYRRRVTPPVLDRLLMNSRAVYERDNLLMWQAFVRLFPVFDRGIRDNRQRSALELQRMQEEGWEVVLRRPGHFVYLERVTDDGRLWIIDSLDGQRKERVPGHYAGVRAAHVRGKGMEVPPVPSPGGDVIQVGLHDERGGEWMREHGVVGPCVVHWTVQEEAKPRDFSRLADAGITVIGRLCYGYADGTGTLPPARARDAFAAAAVQTMLDTSGVAYWHVGNEPNNKAEWPVEGELTPSMVIELYNEIYSSVDGRARLGPPPIDPYYGPGSDNRVWWRAILQSIEGADALFLHCKTQTNNPAEVWSRARFEDWPLEWQYLHLRTAETSLAEVPARFANTPVFVTEVNPQWRERIGGGLGWIAGNGRWVQEAVWYFDWLAAEEGWPVEGVCFYRFEDADPWGLRGRPEILETVRCGRRR